MGSITTEEYNAYCTESNLEEMISQQKAFRVDAYYYSNRMSAMMRMQMKKDDYHKENKIEK